jgi:hypothetical protein
MPPISNKYHALHPIRLEGPISFWSHVPRQTDMVGLAGCDAVHAFVVAVIIIMNINIFVILSLVVVLLVHLFAFVSK